MHLKHVSRGARFSPREIRSAVTAVEGFNAKLAVLITRSVGTMACAYAFGLLALLSFPAAIATGQLIVIVAWVAQTFLQLVLLSIILVGQRVQAAATDAQASAQFADVVAILDRLDTRTDGGLKEVLDALNGPGGIRDQILSLAMTDELWVPETAKEPARTYSGLPPLPILRQIVATQAQARPPAVSADERAQETLRYQKRRAERKRARDARKRSR